MLIFIFLLMPLPGLGLVAFTSLRNLNIKITGNGI
jgi:hypothetical protein